MKKRSLLLSVVATFGFTIASMAQVPNYVPTNGLIGWWPFNGNANDESVNTNDGTVNGATLTTDRFGNANSAYQFNGTTSFITLPSNVNQLIDSSYTISFWIYASSNANVFDGYEILGDRDASTWNYRYRAIFGMSNIGAPQDTLWFQACYGGPTVTISSNSPNLNTWYNYTMVYDGISTFIGYINGITAGTATGVSLLTPGNRQINIGRQVSPGYPAGGSYFNGLVDDIGFWNRALTECEISDLYNSQLGSLNTSATQAETALDTYTWPINSQTYTQSGTYTAVIPNAAGCDSTITLDLSLGFTGINEFSEDNLFTVFPNPAQSAINIKADNKLIGDVYTIYDNTGRVVLTGKLNTKDTTIELNNLSGGIYIFSVGENMKQTFKVIKE